MHVEIKKEDYEMILSEVNNVANIHKLLMHTIGYIDGLYAVCHITGVKRIDGRYYAVVEVRASFKKYESAEKALYAAQKFMNEDGYNMELRKK